MGMRGPGARPKPKPKMVDTRPDKPARKPAWQGKRLSRSGRVINFIESLKLTAGSHAGKPFRLREWQKDIVRKVYDPATPEGLRQVRFMLLTMARKNGKTQLAAALALAHLAGPEAEARGEVYSAASDRNQAARTFREIEAFVSADPSLADRVNILRFAKRIEVLEGPGAGSIYEALSSDARKAHSLSPSCWIFDELAQAAGRELFDNLQTGMGAREEPLAIVISTMSPDPHHVMSEIVEEGRNILAGITTDPTFAPFIFGTPEDADIWAESTWYEANPALGDFRSLDEMRSYAQKAKRIPSRETVFRSLYLNMPVVAGEGRFIGPEEWKACAGPVDREALRGRPCWGGLDLASTRDLTAFVLYFPEDGGAVLPWFWLPADGIDKREHSDRVPYRQWRDEELIKLTPGQAIDKRYVAPRLAAAGAEFDIRGIAFDRWRIADLRAILTDEGIDLPLVDWGQGFASMGPALDATEIAILAGGVAHGGHPILTWNARNAIMVPDPAGNRKIDKVRSTARVDGLQAMCQAIGLYARRPADEAQDWGIDLVVAI